MSASSMQACAAPDSASSQSTPRGRLAKPSAYAASNASRARSSSPRSACSHANVKRYARHAGPLWERSATVPPAGGADERIPLGNSQNGWDEIRAEAARKQLLAKIELGVWTPGRNTATEAEDSAEQTVREMAPDWLEGP